MIISSVKESKLTINTQKIESDTFFPESSLNPLSNSKQINLSIISFLHQTKFNIKVLYAIHLTRRNALSFHPLLKQ